MLKIDSDHTWGPKWRTSKWKK